VIGPPLFMVVKSEGDMVSLAPQLRDVIHAVDPNRPIGSIHTMDAQVARSVVGPRFYMLLLGSFAGVAVALAAVGIYGTMAYAVGQRTREIGVRMALGADPNAVLGLVVRDGIRWSAVGIALGLVGAFGVTRTLERFLYGVTATDPFTLVSVTAMVFGVALLASYLPARRAAGVDPMNTLRN
jgi:ABC-type antimicrobial peptide transport system permease subunit